MKTEKIRFENRKGQILVGHLERPASGKPLATALLAHCFTCGKDLYAVRVLSRSLAKLGFAVLRFDFTGIGESEGDFSETSFATNVEDLQDAATYLANHYRPPQLYVGHSLGGPASVVAASKSSTCEALATIAAPFDPDHLETHFPEVKQQTETQGEAEIEISGSSFTVRKAFFESLRQVDMQQVYRDLSASLMILHSPSDDVVGIDNAASIYRAARHPKNFISLDGANHLLANRKDAEFAGSMIAQWARRYVDVEESRRVNPQKRVGVWTGREPYYTEIAAGNHALVADEPESVGGSDLGPTPYDLLVSGLGACTSMTLRMYADRKEWPLDEVQVHLDHQKIHADDCQNCETESGKVDYIERGVELEGDLTDEQRERLLEIADKCPVHRTLHGEIEVDTRLIQE